MAKMFPTQFPDPANKMRNAEKAFFEACSSQLDDDWTILYDVKYFGQRSQGAERGDIDFLMMHGELGIFCVEVKGGRRIYLQDGEWFTIPHGMTESKKIRDPFVQVADSKSVLWSEIRTELPSLVLSGSLGHFVCFPGAELEKDISLTGRRNLVCDKNDIKNLQVTLRRIANSFGKRTPLSQSEITLIRKVILRDFEILSLSRSNLNEAKEFLEHLTDQQVVAFKMLRNFKELVVTGGAGTGKTVLAFDRACELALQGKRTLFLCHSTALAERLRSLIDLKVVSNLYVFSTREFFAEMTGGAYSALFIFEPRGIKQIDDKVAYYEARFETYFFDSMLEKNFFIDALVIDEAQVVALNLCQLMANFMPGVGERFVYIFGDPRQNTLLFEESALDFSPALERVLLEVNCRSTDEIAVAAHTVFSEKNRLNGLKGPKPMLAKTIEGKSLNGLSGIGNIKANSKLVRHLIEVNGINPQEVKIVVAGKSIHHGEWAHPRDIIINPDNWEGQHVVNDYDLEENPSLAEIRNRQLELLHLGGHLIEVVPLPDLQGLEADGIIFEMFSLDTGLSKYQHGFDDLLKEAEKWSEEILSAIKFQSPHCQKLSNEAIDILNMPDPRRKLFEHFRNVVFTGITRARHSVILTGNQIPISLAEVLLNDRAENLVIESFE
jgi:hypothetical protein